MKFMDEDFLLGTETARQLYHTYAEHLPIIDYHCHISPEQIARDHRFSGITELLLGGDHYKWRAMRSFGIEERLITGDGDDYEKFSAFASMMPFCIGNPLYHWTHLELKRYFGIDVPLSPATAEDIYRRANALLATDGYTARGLIARSNVEVICTTDDPADNLCYHEEIRRSGFGTRVLPAFRPDKAVSIHKAAFLPYIQAAGITSYEGLLTWLSARMDHFHAAGCRLSDHGVDFIPMGEGDPAPVFARALRGEPISDRDANIYEAAVLRFCGAEYARRDWTMQIHVGALRDNSTDMYRKLGADTGFDSIGDRKLAESLSRLLDSLDRDGVLPRTILYSLNPCDNYTIGALMGCFQRAPYRSKVQLGAGWWFNDQRDGMEAQLRTFANLGILGCFVGMLTDSRSLVSYPRHEYFRRILCNLLGNWVENGEYPNDPAALGEIVRGICHDNAARYFRF